MCFLGGFLIWMLNALNKNYSTTIRCPVEYGYEEKEVIVVKAPSENILVNVRGGGWNLLRRTFFFNRNPLQIYLENPTHSNYLTGNLVLPEISGQLSEFIINFIASDTIYYDIQPKTEKLLFGVIDSTKIDLEESCQIVSPVHIDPDTFRITAPKKLADTLGKYFEIPIDQKKINKSFDKDIVLEFYRNELVNFNPSTVHVSFKVERIIPEELDIPVKLVNFPKDSSVLLKYPYIRVRYKVRESYATQLSPVDFDFSVNYRKINRKDSTVNLDMGEIPVIVQDFKTDTTVLKVVYVRK